MVKNCETCAHVDCDYWDSPCYECLTSNSPNYMKWEAREEAEKALEEAK